MTVPGVMRLDPDAPYHRLVGVGGIGTGLFFALEGDRDLGRNESRPARLLDVRDYCKLHIVAHYPAVLLGARPRSGTGGQGDAFHVLPMGKVGADDVGRRLRNEMASAGMDVRFVEAVAGRPTLFSVCFQYPDGSGGNLTTTESAATALVPEDVDRLEPMLDRQTIALAAPEVPLVSRLRLLQLGTAHGAFRAAAVASTEVGEARALGLFAHADLLSMNQDEAGALVGAAFPAGDPSPFLEACATVLTALQPHVRIVVTAGRRGAWGFAEDRWDHCPALPVPVISTAGAGDALLGGVLAALAAGVPFTVPGPPRSALAERPLRSALDLGVCLAAFSVTSPHTIHPETTLAAVTLFAREYGLDFDGELLRATEGAAP